MYQTKVIHPLVGPRVGAPAEITETLWSLFVAVGDRWALGDDPANYRLRYMTFLENRIEVDPLYDGYYRDGAALLDELAASIGSEAAFELIFGNKPKVLPTGIPTSRLELLQRFVANEFIALRLALGGFKAFGAINYCGYFGGANIEGEETPYRERGSR